MLCVLLRPCLSLQTTDGGSTWNTVFTDKGNFYFNGIDCQPSNPLACCAVGESDDGAAPGARIHCTFDGGKSWNRTFWAPATPSLGFSLMDIAYASDTDVWAAGKSWSFP